MSQPSWSQKGGPGGRNLKGEESKGPSPASGSMTLGMLVEMLVERVFLVGGVVKTVFPLIKKKRFFLFFTTNKRK